MSPTLKLALGILFGLYVAGLLGCVASRALTVYVVRGSLPSHVRESIEDDDEDGALTDWFEWLEVAWEHQPGRVVVAIAVEALLWPLVLVKMVPDFTQIVGGAVGGADCLGISHEEVVERSKNRFRNLFAADVGVDRESGESHMRIVHRGATHYFSRAELDEPGPALLKDYPGVRERFRREYDRCLALEADLANSKVEG